LFTDSSLGIRILLFFIYIKRFC